ncbi:MAG: LppX_LprAFG lipoprotein [Chloroflexota bacterium]|nr:LppX_LprAFG lipoprotein [Chloroflexota bacterium]MDE2885193.1 LppX_LprAFG lipoprotein [Chloroflexota bacterium]
MAVLAVGILLLAACEAEPTPTPELSVEDVLSGAAEELAALSTAKFQMVDEMESGAKFFEMTLKSVEGEVKTPDSFRMLVELVNPGLGFVEIEMMAVGEQAYMKFSADAPWTSLPVDAVPFNFGGIGVTLSEILLVIEAPAITGRESVGGAQAIRIYGDVVSEEMSGLITDVDSGHAITLTLWIDEVSHNLKQLRIAGKLYDEDAPETTRLVVIEDIDAPVDIQLPEVTSGS